MMVVLVGGAHAQTTPQTPVSVVELPPVQIVGGSPAPLLAAGIPAFALIGGAAGVRGLMRAFRRRKAWTGDPAASPRGGRSTRAAPVACLPF